MRGRKILLREGLLERLGTEWLRKQQEIVEGELAKIEVAKDTIDFNILELELSSQNWQLGKMTQVLNLDEQAVTDPMIDIAEAAPKRRRIRVPKGARRHRGRPAGRHLRSVGRIAPHSVRRRMAPAGPDSGPAGAEPFSRRSERDPYETG